jgi:hypothetical protein
MLLARLVAVAVHEIITEFRTEYDRLTDDDAGGGFVLTVPAEPGPGAPPQTCDITGTTGAQVERSRPSAARGGAASRSRERPPRSSGQ